MQVNQSLHTVNYHVQVNAAYQEKIRVYVLSICAASNVGEPGLTHTYPPSGIKRSPYPPAVDTTKSSQNPTSRQNPTPRTLTSSYLLDVQSHIWLGRPRNFTIAEVVALSLNEGTQRLCKAEL